MYSYMIEGDMSKIFKSDPDIPYTQQDVDPFDANTMDLKMQEQEKLILLKKLAVKLGLDPKKVFKDDPN